MQNKLQNKKFLNVDTRIINDTGLDLKSCVYIIEFKNKRYKIGCAGNIEERLRAYKPYEFIVKSITLYVTSDKFKLERDFLSNDNNDLFYGNEWFIGVPNYEKFEALYASRSSNATVEHKYREFNKKDMIDAINLILPNKKMMDFELVLTILTKGYRYDGASNWVTRFYDWFYSITDVNRYKVLEIMCPLNIDIDVILDFINIYIRDSKFIMGKILKYDETIDYIMGKLIGVDGRVKKEELKLYQDQTTIDLLEVHDFMTSKFVTAYMFTDSHKEAKDMVYNAALKKYPFKLSKSA